MSEHTSTDFGELNIGPLFHARDGWHFARLDDNGGVYIRKFID
jgi:hypothetical protein